MIVIGHRGARGEAPENTLPSFLHAMKAGIRNFELDVRLSWDERPVVIHDEKVDRTTGEDGAVAGFPASQLAAMDARSNTPGWPLPAGIPTLEEVLLACGDVDHWQLEIKADKPARIRILMGKIAELLERLKMADRATLTSLDRNVLKIARQEVAQLARGYVAETNDPAPVAAAEKLACSLLVSNWRITGDDLVRDAHAAGLAVSVWTVNDLMIAERLINLGVDSIITDFPTAVLAHVRMRELLAGNRPS